MLTKAPERASYHRSVWVLSVYNDEMRGVWIALVLVAASAEPGWADRITEADEIGPKLKLSTRIKQNLNDYSNEIGSGLSELTLGLLDMHFDLHEKRAKLHLGGGDPDAFRLRIASDVLMAGGNARVQARIDLAVAGHRLAFEVPEFDMNTASVSGERAIQLSLPLLEGDF